MNIAHLRELCHISLETCIDAPPMSVTDNQQSVLLFGVRYDGMDFLWIMRIMKVNSTNRSISKLTDVTTTTTGRFPISGKGLKTISL